MIILWWVTFIFLLIRFLVTALNYWFPQVLENDGAPVTDLVSVLIPARNEEHTIGLLLQSIHEQNFKNCEVLVLDDFSEDNTASVVKEFRKTDVRVKLLQGKELPEKMLGKNWACHQLAMAAKGKYLLFLDADVTIKDDFISNAVNTLKKDNLALLSVFPDQKMESREEILVVPLMNYLLLSLLPMFLIRKSSIPAFSAAVGQCMLYNAAIYKKHSVHLAVGANITEDIASMKLLKDQGYSCHSVMGNGFIECRMYRNYTEGIEGFSKNILTAFGNNYIGLPVYLFLTLGAYLIFMWFIPKTNLWLAFILIGYMRFMISKISRQNIFNNIVYHPWQMLTLIHISLLAIHKKITKTNQWKGRATDL